MFETLTRLLCQVCIFVKEIHYYHRYYQVYFSSFLLENVITVVIERNSEIFSDHLK